MIDTHTELEWLTELLTIVAQGDACEELWWVARDGQLRFFIDCSDTFYWACAECEPVESGEDLSALREAWAEAQGTEKPHLWTDLWVCRRRGMRPMNAWMEKVVGDDSPQIRVLFEAAGPPRDSEMGAP